MVLEILEVLPEVMTEEKIVIEDEIRAAFIKFAMERLQPEVLKTLNVACSSQGLKTKRRYQIINCFQSWMIEQTSEPVKKAIHELNLLPFCYNELKLEGENNDEAADAIISCMHLCSNSFEYQALYQNIIQGLFSGRERFEHFLSQNSEDEVYPFISVYSVLVGKILDQMLLDPNSEAIKFMLQGIFLKSIQTGLREIVSKSFHSITTIVKKLKNAAKEDPERMERVGKFVEVYMPWFEAVIIASCENARLSTVGIYDIDTYDLLRVPE